MKEITAELLLNDRSQKSRDAEPEIMESLAANGFNVRKVNRLTADKHWPKVMADIGIRRPKLLIIGGGDGTISDLAGYLADSSIEIGLLPLGTTNNFARSLNIPLDIREAIKIIKSAEAHQIDLGKINDDYFTNVTGVGLSALVADNVTNKAKRRWKRLAYAIVGIQQLFKHKPFLATVEDKDHELKLYFETHQIIIANGRYHAGKEIAEDTTLDNGELVIFALGGPSKLSFLWNMMRFYIGKRRRVAHTSYLIGKNIRLRTNSPQLVELDGEVKFTTPVAAKVMPSALKLRYKP